MEIQDTIRQYNYISFLLSGYKKQKQNGTRSSLWSNQQSTEPLVQESMRNNQMHTLLVPGASLLIGSSANIYLKNKSSIFLVLHYYEA